MTKRITENDLGWTDRISVKAVADQLNLLWEELERLKEPSEAGLKAREMLKPIADLLSPPEKKEEWEERFDESFGEFFEERDNEEWCARGQIKLFIKTEKEKSRKEVIKATKKWLDAQHPTVIPEVARDSLLGLLDSLDSSSV